MARVISGINGPFSGKVGTVIGFHRNGSWFMKVASKKKRTSATEKEKLNREKFAHAQFWLQPLKEFVRAGFRNYSPTAQGFIAAKSLLLKQAFTTGPDLFIEPSLAMVSFGDLPLPPNIQLTEQADELIFTWDTKDLPNTDPCDQAMLLAYDITGSTAIYKTTGQFRYTGKDVLKVEPRPGITYLVYFAFVAADRSRQSMSVFLGAITF